MNKDYVLTNISVATPIFDNGIGKSFLKNSSINVPSKHLLVLKTSSTRLQRDSLTSSRRLGRRKNCYAEDVVKTS